MDVQGGEGSDRYWGCSHLCGLNVRLLMETVRKRQNKLVGETCHGIFEAEGILREPAIVTMAKSTIGGATGVSV